MTPRRWSIRKTLLLVALAGCADKQGVDTTYLPDAATPTDAAPRSTTEPVGPGAGEGDGHAARDAASTGIQPSARSDAGARDSGTSLRDAAAAEAGLPAVQTDASTRPATPDASDEPDSGSSVIEAGIGETPPVAVKICDGSDGLVLYASTYSLSGTAYPPGAEFLGQNGDYIAIDGNCTAYCLHWNGRAFTRHLDREAERSLTLQAELSNLPNFAGQHAVSLCDGPTDVLVTPSLSAQSNAGCGDVPEEVELLARKVQESVAAARTGCGAEPEWSRATGAVRFSLLEVEEGTFPPDADLTWFRAAPEWPLGEPSDVARKEDSVGVSDPATAQVALGEAADALQSLLDQFIAGEIGYQAMGFIPIEQPDGRRFQLYVRDAIPWEDERGFIPFDFAPPAEDP